MTSQAATVLGAAAAVEGVAPPACACLRLPCGLPHDLALGRPDAIRCAVSKGHAMSCNLFGAAKHQSGLSQDSVSRGRRRGSCFTRGARCLGALRNLKRAHGWQVFARHEGTTGPLCALPPRTPSAWRWRTRYGPAECDQPSSTTTACSEFGCGGAPDAAPDCPLHHKLRDVPSTAGSTQLVLRAFAWRVIARAIPSLRLRSSQLGVVCDGRGPSRFSAREHENYCIFAALQWRHQHVRQRCSYLRAHLLPLLIQFIFVPPIHDSLTTLTPFFTLSHLFDGATAIHSTAQSNGYKGCAPVPTLPARQRGALFRTGTASLTATPNLLCFLHL